MDESSSGVGEKSLPQEFGEFDFVSEEGSGDIDAFTSNDGNSLSAKKSFGKVGGQSSQKMSFCINYDQFLEHL